MYFVLFAFPLLPLSTDNTAPSSMKANEGQTIKLPSCAIEMTRYQRNSYGENGAGYEFDKWNTSADGSGTAYAAGASFKVTSTVTLYATYISRKQVQTLTVKKILQPWISVLSLHIR